MVSAFYFDPQYAERTRPNAAAFGRFYSEQYAVAALLYEMCTGAHYLNFSLNTPNCTVRLWKKRRYHLPHTVSPPGRVERILSRALRKEPSDRFADMADMLAALDAIDNLPTTNKVPELTPESAEFIGEVLDTYRPDGDLYQHGCLVRRWRRSNTVRLESPIFSTASPRLKVTWNCWPCRPLGNLCRSADTAR